MKKYVITLEITVIGVPNGKAATEEVDSLLGNNFPHPFEIVEVEPEDEDLSES